MSPLLTKAQQRSVANAWAKNIHRRAGHNTAENAGQRLAPEAASEALGDQSQAGTAERPALPREDPKDTQP